MSQDAKPNASAPPLTAIKGSGSGPHSWRRRSLEESEQITCSVCETRDGVATSAVLQLTVAPRRAPGGKVVGGSRILACAHCLSKGIITELAAL